jgi:hypothetical protein
MRYFSATVRSGTTFGTAARDTILERLTLAHEAGSLARIYRESIA